MMAKPYRALLLLIFLSYSAYALSCDEHTKKSASTNESASSEETTSTEKSASNENSESAEEVSSTEEDVLVGDSKAGEERYKKSCINCHGAAGKGVASYPKISGNEISYTKSKLEAYREGITIGPNSSLMIMMAKPLTDEEIANLATYLKEATH